MSGCFIYVDGIPYDVSNLLPVTNRETSNPLEQGIDNRNRARRKNASRLSNASPYQFDVSITTELLKYVDISPAFQAFGTTLSPTMTDSKEAPKNVSHRSSEDDTEDETSFYSDDESVAAVGIPEQESHILFDSNMEFRGAKETWSAIQAGRYATTRCVDCGLCMACVEDAEYVVCSNCRLISPLNTDKTASGKKAGPSYGIGMGFKREWCIKLLQEQKIR